MRLSCQSIAKAAVVWGVIRDNHHKVSEYESTERIHMLRIITGAHLFVQGIRAEMQSVDKGVLSPSVR